MTTAEVTTGSVGASTAPSRKASAQLSEPKSALATRASSTIVIGIAITSERATGLQWRRSSSRSTNIPSEKRVRISANSTSSTIARSRRVYVHDPSGGEGDPERNREDGGGEDRPAHQPRERRDHREQPAEEQHRFAEADVHRR